MEKFYKTINKENGNNLDYEDGPEEEKENIDEKNNDISSGKLIYLLYK